MRIAEEDKIEEKKWRRERERKGATIVDQRNKNRKIGFMKMEKKKRGMKYDDDRKIKFEI